MPDAAIRWQDLGAATVTVAAPDPDTAWLERAAQGDERAFAVLVDRHLKRLHALAWRALGSTGEADEVTQETLVRAWRKLPDWRSDGAQFGTWLQRVALNLVNDRLRERRPRVALEDAGLVNESADPERRHAREQQSARVRAALQDLPERQRDALLLCHFEGLSQAEAAATLEVSVDALESLLARARRSLRQTLLPEHDPGNPP